MALYEDIGVGQMNAEPGGDNDNHCSDGPVSNGAQVLCE